jgi:hypothetical protein
LIRMVLMLILGNFRVTHETAVRASQHTFNSNDLAS